MLEPETPTNNLSNISINTNIHHIYNYRKWWKYILELSPSASDSRLRIPVSSDIPPVDTDIMCKNSSENYQI